MYSVDNEPHERESHQTNHISAQTEQTVSYNYITTHLGLYFNLSGGTVRGPVRSNSYAGYHYSTVVTYHWELRDGRPRRLGLER